MVQILEANKSLTVADGREECTIQFPSVKARAEAAGFLKEYRDRMSHVRQGECQKRIGQAIACFSGKEVMK